MKSKHRQNLSAALKAAVALVIFAVAVINYDKLKNIDVRAIVETSSSFAAAVGAILGVYLVKSVLFVIPASLIYIAVGMAFTPWQAVAINFAGIVLEVVVTYLLGLFLGGEYVNNLLKKSKGGQKILDLQFNNRFLVLFSIRFLPVFPIDFVSLFWGASKCNFLKYFAASILGIMPRVILFTILGDGIYDYIPIHLIVKGIIIAIPIGVVVFLVRYFVKAKKPAETEAES